MIKIKDKHGQQEIVGFVLIVVLVVVALMVFLVISVRKAPATEQSVEVENILGVVMDYTTDCAIVFEPDYDTIEDLVKSCYNNKKCDNLGEMACDYLEETLDGVMKDLMKTESSVNAYQFDVLERGEGESAEGTGEEILKVEGGECMGTVSGASVPIKASSVDLVVRLRICKDI